MTDRELMELAVEALMDLSEDSEDVIHKLQARIKQLKNQETWYALPKEAREKIALANLNNRNTWNDTITPMYEQAKYYRNEGLTVDEACAKAGITRDQWYRRKNIERYGKSRKKTPEF